MLSVGVSHGDKLQPLLGWINRLEKRSLEKPYKGFTVDGTVQEGIHNYAEDEGAPAEEVVVNVEALLSMLPEEAKKQVKCGEVEDDDFRLWSNLELYVNPGRPSQCINMIFCLYSRQ
jgi:hypothetical protein